MKRLLLIVIAVMFVVSYSFAAVLNSGISLGLGTVSDSDLSKVYGSGFVINPYLGVEISDVFFIGLGYESGYKKEGDVGIYKENATLKISGFQLFAEYRIKVKKFAPFLKLGYGSYTVKNSFKMESLKKYAFSKRSSGVILGGGLRLPLSDSFSFTGELDYLILKVKPFDRNVNIGGIRVLVGLTINFNI